MASHPEDQQILKPSFSLSHGYFCRFSRGSLLGPFDKKKIPVIWAMHLSLLFVLPPSPPQEPLKFTPQVLCCLCLLGRGQIVPGWLSIPPGPHLVYRKHTQITHTNLSNTLGRGEALSQLLPFTLPPKYLTRVTWQPATLPAPEDTQPAVQAASRQLLSPGLGWGQHPHNPSPRTKGQRTAEPSSNKSLHTSSTSVLLYLPSEEDFQELEPGVWISHLKTSIGVFLAT